MSSYNFLVHSINRRIARSLPYRGTVIDLGCGTAPYKSDILETGDAYIGVDWDRGFHDQSNVDVFADLTFRLPFLDESADTIVLFQVIEHVPEPGLVLAECHRILRRGGALLITVPFMWRVHEAPHDYYRYTRHGLEYLLDRAGFGGIAIRENTGFWQTWTLGFNYHTSRFGKGPLALLWAPLWWLGQVVSPLLDRIDPNHGESASYTVTAYKDE